MKSNILKVIMGLVFLVIFNGLYFYLDSEHTEVDWICYGFIHASYLFILLTPLFCKSGKGLEVLSYSLYLRALFYFFTELLVGCICILIGPESIIWPLVIQCGLLAIFLVLQIMSVLANDATLQSIQKQRKESLFLHEMSDKIRIRIRTITDTTLKKQVEKCYDIINYSSLESYPEAKEVESKLRDTVDRLCIAIDNGDCKQIEINAKAVMDTVEDRNIIIKRCRIN